MRLTLTVVFLLVCRSSFASESANYCKEFFSEANYLPYLKTISQSFSFSRDNGIQVDKKVIERFHLNHYASDASHRIESDPQKLGPLKGIKEGVQITSENSDPPAFKVTEDYLEHYRENFLLNPALGKPAPLKMHLFEYTFGFRNGICIPTSVIEVGENLRKSVFDFDRCYQAKDGHSVPSKDLNCSHLAVYGKILADKRFDHSLNKSENIKLPTAQ